MRDNIIIKNELDGFSVSIPVNEYDVVYTFFLARTNNDEQTARSFADIIFQVAAITDESAMTLLDKFNNLDDRETLVLVSYYLNIVKSASALVGVGTVLRPSFYAFRNVVQ
jgi:hypothetical protein